MAGKIRSGDRILTKPGHTFPHDIPLTLEKPEIYVSRGGSKLAMAFRIFDLDVDGQIAVDIGASTGGFTDCLLQHGAAKVYAVDVGRGQLHYKLQQDPRVQIMDGINGRYLEPGLFTDSISFATVDCSFISLTKILPTVDRIIQPGATIVTLIKPQFEAGRSEISKGGVVRSREIRYNVIEKIRLFVEAELHWSFWGICQSPIRGPAGNVEFLGYWEKEDEAGR